jgi:hypothetical protein
VDPKRVRELMRLEQTVSDARLRNAIKTGMAETNAELYDYRLRQIAAGFKHWPTCLTPRKSTARMCAFSTTSAP